MSVIEHMQMLYNRWKFRDEWADRNNSNMAWMVLREAAELMHDVTIADDERAKERLAHIAAMTLLWAERWDNS